MNRLQRKALAAELRAAFPSTAVFDLPGDQRRAYEMGLQAQHDHVVRGIANWLIADVPGFDRAAFYKDCTPEGERPPL